MNSEISAKPVAAIVMTSMFWGLSFVSTKTLLDHLVPMEIAFYRHVLAVAASWTMLLSARARVRIVRSDMLRMAAAALFGIPVYFFFENTGLVYTSAATASIIVASTPALTALAESLIHKRSLTRTTWTGIALSILGVYYVVSMGGHVYFGPAYMKGNMMILAASAAWVVYTIANRPLVQRYGVLTTNAVQISLATAVMGLAVIGRGFPTNLATTKVALNLLYLGVICSAISYSMYLFALKSLGSTATTTFINLVPVFGVTGGALILGEPLTMAQVIGGLAVVTGIFVVTKTPAVQTARAAESPGR